MSNWLRNLILFVVYFVGGLLFFWEVYGRVMSGEITFIFKLFIFVVGMSWTKAVMGWRFTWERCDCCGKSMGQHKDMGQKPHG